MLPIVREKLGPNVSEHDVLNEAFRMMQRESQRLNQIFTFKLGPFRTETLRFLDTELNARVTMMLRDNAIDRSICDIRDCFNRKGGVPVVAVNGSETSLCFKRRQAKDVVVQANCTIGKWPDQVLWYDRVAQRERSSFNSYHHKAQNYEELFLSSSSTDSAVFRRSVDAWVKLMEPLIDNVNRSIVESVLEEGRGTRPPPTPHSKLIYNFDDAVRDLRKHAPAMAEKYLRW